MSDRTAPVSPGWLAAGIAGVAAVAAGAYMLYEKQATPRPEYRVELQDGDLELRDYPELVVAEARFAGERAAALNKGFEALAAYIFARHRGGSEGGARNAEKIAMTAPVLSDRDSATATGTDSWRTRFIMPGEYRIDTLPEPPPGIELATLPARRLAVIRFSGYANPASLASAEARLRDWIATRALTVRGAVEYAFYDSPMIPGPLRRNEVLIPV